MTTGTNDFPNVPPSLNSVASHAAALTLSDTVELTHYSRALYIGGAGNLKVTMLGGEVVTFNGLAAGTILPVRIILAWSTGSTASATLNIVALW